MLDLEEIVALLDRQKQRATYGAVAGLLGVHERSLMNDRPRTPLNSWIVNAKSKRPTGYSEAEIHHALVVRQNVIADPEALAKWVAGQKCRSRVPP